MAFFSVNPFDELMRMHDDMERMHQEVFGGADLGRLPLTDGHRHHNHKHRALAKGSQQQEGGQPQTQLANTQPAGGLLSTLGGLGGLEHWRPRWDIKQTDDAIQVHCELPGVNKDDVKVEVNNGVLSVSGKRENEKEEKNENYYVKERSSGSFYRSVRLPEGVKEEDVKARFNNGMLDLTIARPKEAQKRQISIE